MALETRQGLLKKLGIYTAIAVGLVVVGKQHIAAAKDNRYKAESDASLEADNEFVDTSRRPGFPSHNPNLNYEGSARESKYVGAGVAYSTRTKGDRLSLWNVFKAKTTKDE